MNDVLRYKAGSDVALPLRFRFHFGEAGLSGTVAAGITRFIEFWCQQNCRGRWAIAQTDFEMRLSFGNSRDMVLFHLTDEYARFSSKSGAIIEAPTIN